MDKIIIQYSKENLWTVTVGDKQAVGLCYEEMLGLVAQVTVPEEKKALMWLKTKEQHSAQEEYFKKLRQKKETINCVSKNKHVRIGKKKWWFKGYVIERYKHRKHIEYITTQDKDVATKSELDSPVALAHKTLMAALKFCKKNPVLDPHRTPQNYL